MNRTIAVIFLCAALFGPRVADAQDILIPMESGQSDHLKAYGVAYWALERGIEIDWLLNYRGGAFLLQQTNALETELRVRGVSYERLNGSQTASIIATVESDAENTAVVRLEKPPKIAVYA
ncbi:MAG: asparagine synthetase B, partial [Rhodothermales bacterium]|nr:asparagine synthetase B [Rhodothermales bacterium]